MSRWVPVAVFIVIITFWAGCWLLTTHFLGTWEERGQFGDLFGAVNALFSGLAFAALILALLLQREELRQNTEALRLQADELKHQVEETRALVRESQAQAQAATGMLDLGRQNYQRERAREHDEAKPRFVYNGGSHSGPAQHQCNFRNVGAPAHNLRALGRDASGASVQVFVNPSYYVDSEGSPPANPPQGRGSFVINSEVVLPLLVSITYVDKRDVEDTMHLSVDGNWIWTRVTYDSDDLERY